MRAHRIAVMFHESLVLEGLVNFLAERADLQVTGLDSSLPDVAARLRRLSPEVIIVDGESSDAHPDLTLSQILTNNPGARVIDVDPGRDEIRVYQQRRVSVGKFDDLLEAFGAAPSSSTKDGDGASTERASEQPLR